MTFAECKDLLRDLRREKARLRRKQNEIEELKHSIDTLSLRSSLGCEIRVQSGQSSSVVERVVERLDELCRQYADELELMMNMEDTLNAARKTLTQEEDDVIVEYYMHGMPIRKIAETCFMSERKVFYVRNRAIRKFCETL